MLSIVSTTSVPTSASMTQWKPLWTLAPGPGLDADHPETGSLFHAETHSSRRSLTRRFGHPSQGMPVILTTADESWMTAPADDPKVAKAASNRILRVVARGVKEAGRADMRKSRFPSPSSGESSGEPPAG